MKILVILWLLGCCSFCNTVNKESMQSTIIEDVKKNNLEAVDAALKNGTDVNTADEKKRSLLLLATQAANLAMAQLLVSYRANVNQQDDILDSPFLYAGATGQTALLQLFLKHGARFDVFNRYNGSALIPACERGHVETVKLLANTKGFPVDHVNRLGWTGLLEAVILGDGSAKYQQIVRILKEAGCNIHIADKNGVTSLQHARSLGYKEIVHILSSD
ncbi:ankyrin repeat domain-containing protein [Niabella hibiscisoli]|uniref:ankyrin repeat domain-containing protein n=1 Tax=Niabella hibiscisoli TaxID=1825928 RepID=UPI001F10B4F2|nr:ankyrin repeat domain-containing protein [Niabella hibiscisoli]MCH5721082.1 ankyrin repeat domain-containing protein [Niabella hibiscisoli]